MKTIEDIKSWADLLELIMIEHSELSKKKVATEVIGIAEKSYFDIKNGKIPKEKLIRVFKGFVRKNYNAELIEGKGMDIKIKQNISVNGNNNVVKDSQIYNGSKSKEKQIDSLLNRIIELEDERKEMKEKLKRRS